MTLESCARGHETYLNMLNKGMIQNGLGGKIEKGDTHNPKTKWIKQVKAPKFYRAEGRFIDFRSF